MWVYTSHTALSNVGMYIIAVIKALDPKYLGKWPSSLEAPSPVDNLQTFGKAMLDPATSIVMWSTIRLAKFLDTSKDPIFVSLREWSFRVWIPHSFTSCPNNESEFKNIRPFIPVRRLVHQDSLPSLVIKNNISLIASTTSQRRNIMTLRFLFLSLNLFQTLV